jgi:NADPH:quinone reductase-like Zn-dependent oxidoreductase
MKAVVVENYDSIDNIRLKDVAMPDVSAGQVRVSNLNCTAYGSLRSQGRR